MRATPGLIAGVLGILGGLLRPTTGAGCAVSGAGTLLFLLAFCRLWRALGEPGLLRYGANALVVSLGDALGALAAAVLSGGRLTSRWCSSRPRRSARRSGGPEVA